MTPLWLAILFFALGVTLLVAEVLLPTHGLLGILGAVGLICGIGACFFINQYLGLATAVLVVGLTPFALGLWLKVWPHTPVGRRLILAPPDAAALEAAGARATAPLPRVQVGQVGVVISELRPGGVCEFGDERAEARCENSGGVIPAGRRVEVVAVVDHRPLVRAVADDKV